MPTGIKRQRNDTNKLAGSYDYMPSQQHPLLSNPPMMTYHPQGFHQQQELQQELQQQQQQPNFNYSSFNEVSNFQGFKPYSQQSHALDMSYQLL